MYLALQVAAGRENEAIKIFEKRLESEGLDENHLSFKKFTRNVTKFVAGKWQKVQENVMPGYIYIELFPNTEVDLENIKNRAIYLLKTIVEFVSPIYRITKVFEISDTNIRQIIESAKGDMVQIPEPAAVDYDRKSKKAKEMLSRVNKLSKNRSCFCKKRLEALKQKLKTKIELARQKKEEYLTFLRLSNIFASYKVIRGKKMVLEFPAQLLVRLMHRSNDIISLNST